MRLGLLGLFLCLAALGRPSVQAIETFGDSLTRGYFAELSLTARPLTPLQVRLAFAKLASTLGNRERLDAQARPDLAWPKFLSETLTQNDEAIPQLINQSSVNTTSGDLLRQVNGIPESKKPTAAFFFMGHNDLCDRHKTPDDLLQTRFRRAYQQALEKWNDRHQNSVAYLLPIGNIAEVYTKLWKHPWSADKRQTCEFTYTNYAPLCPHFAELTANNKIVDVVGGRRKKLNDDLKELADTLTRQSKNNRFVYLEKLEGLELRPDYFSIDCFHLSEAGQRALADAIAELIS
jgi:lysophospholipase L1-like esterase